MVQKSPYGMIPWIGQQRERERVDSGAGRTETEIVQTEKWAHLRVTLQTQLP